MTRLPSTVDDAFAALEAVGYIPTRALATTVFVAAKLEKPILVEGPAGVGKTALAKALAAAQETELVRLQCYEGLDEAKTLYEWQYPKQLLYTQMLRDKIGDVVAGAGTLAEAVDRIAEHEDAFFSERFLIPRPLLRALRADERVVLLVDEIDRAEDELEAFLLEVLAEFQVTVPELGTIRARHKPLVVLTSNDTRELSDALRRRCVHLPIGFPDAEREMAILRTHVPGLDDRLLEAIARFVEDVRALDLKKRPSVSETIDWARALTELAAGSLDDDIVRDTLGVLIKYDGDEAVVAASLTTLLGREGR